MSTLQICWRVFFIWLFHNRGVDDVIPVAIAAFALWTLLAFIYVLSFEPERLPKFFGVSPRRARWR